MWSAFVCSPETGKKSAEKADKMGISRKFRVVSKERSISTLGQNFDGALSMNQNLSYD